MLKSSICRQSDFSADWYVAWRNTIAAGAPYLQEEQQKVWGPVWAGMQGNWMHRKLWEWCAIAQALYERGMLQKGKTGIGFAVGLEPLASLFAASGASIIASDFSGENADEEWLRTGQLAGSLQSVHWPGLIPEHEFRERVRYENVDMRDLSALSQENLDFLWSACAFEHLGSIENGLLFVREALECLRPGGIAVHTTEYNISSNEATIENGNSVIYRRRDIEALDRSLNSIGCVIEELDFEPGTDKHDVDFDFPPYYTHGRQHIKLRLDDYVSSSLLLIIRKKD
jgi:SAM-dependent methyltransferase